MRLWITFPYCIITQFSMNMETFYCINIIDLDFLLAVLCYIQYMYPIAIPSFLKKNLWILKYIWPRDIQIWGCGPEWSYSIFTMESKGLVSYLGSVPRVVTGTIQQDRIHLLKFKLSTLFIKEPWQMLMLILQWTLDSPYIFQTKCPAWNKRVCLVFRAICLLSTGFQPTPSVPSF